MIKIIKEEKENLREENKKVPTFTYEEMEEIANMIYQYLEDDIDDLREDDPEDIAVIIWNKFEKAGMI